LVLIRTNDLHHWLWLGFEVGVYVVPLSAPGWWLVLGCSLCLVLVNLTAFAWLFARSPQHRLPVALVLVGGIASRLALIVDFGTVPLGLRSNLSALLDFRGPVVGYLLLHDVTAETRAREAQKQQEPAGHRAARRAWRAVHVVQAVVHAGWRCGAAAADAHRWRRIVHRDRCPVRERRRPPCRAAGTTSSRGSSSR
jgi:hypothetical protein